MGRKEMREFLNKSVWIKIKSDNGFLYFTAKKVVEVSDTHITFIDKFDEMQMFLISDVVQIKELKNEEKEND